jgi:hypothetical protein
VKQPFPAAAAGGGRKRGQPEPASDSESADDSSPLQPPAKRAATKQRLDALERSNGDLNKKLDEVMALLRAQARPAPAPSRHGLDGDYSPPSRLAERFGEKQLVLSSPPAHMQTMSATHDGSSYHTTFNFSPHIGPTVNYNPAVNCNKCGWSNFVLAAKCSNCGAPLPSASYGKH